MTPAAARSNGWRSCSKTPGLKLSSVASSVWSKSAKAMVEALIAGERDPEKLADMSLSVMRAKRDRMADAFGGG